MSFLTGTTLYLKNKCFSGYNIVTTAQNGILIFDMNGNEVRRYNLNAMPAKLLKGGNIMATSKFRSSDYSLQDGVELIEIDYDGKKLWGYDGYRYIDENQGGMWSARAHGDYQREGNPVGYYVPGMEAKSNSGKTLILAHDNIIDTNISDKEILDEVIYEVDYEGNILWKYSFSKNFKDIGFSEQEKNVIYRNPNIKNIGKGLGDYLHISSIAYLGPNKWFDQGDFRFHPDNIIFSSMIGNFIGIVDKKYKKIVWKVGPSLNDENFRKLGGIIGPTHIQMIPRGLPGEGNILIFEGGGASGYGYPNVKSPMGVKNSTRDYSRVMEFNPITFNMEDEINPQTLGYSNAINRHNFYSPYGSSAQRLPNGNTLIALGGIGTIMEITEDKEIVWEWVCPYSSDIGNAGFYNLIYHAYRYPYDYLPIDKPKEIEMKRIDRSTFKLPKAGKFKEGKLINIEGAEIGQDIDFITIAIEHDEVIEKHKKILKMESSHIKSINSKNFDNRLAEGEKAIVIHGGARCLHCNSIREMMSELLENEFSNISCFYLDIDENKSFIKKHEIKSLPTTIFYKDSKEIFRFIGEKSYDEIASFIEDKFKEITKNKI
ncbi:MAG: thioredoxin domain-containing protein [Peptoniphilaceae bacterium]